MANIGYIRVSSIDQHIDRQEIALKQIGMDKIYSEKISGKDINRPELTKMLSYVRDGDVLYVESISRLARSTRDLLSIVERLQNKNVALVSLKEHIDTLTPQGRFVLTLFGALSELERESILQRQREGIDAAKAKGQRLGRPIIQEPVNFNQVVKIWKSGEITATEAMKRLNLNRGTFYRMANKKEAINQIAP